MVPVNLKEVTNAGPITEGEIQRLGKKISKLNRSISELISKK
ncbi:MAG: hypothetical protein WD157_00080 [Patescibacteria group bacterium]